MKGNWKNTMKLKLFNNYYHRNKGMVIEKMVIGYYLVSISP